MRRPFSDLPSGTSGLSPLPPSASAGVAVRTTAPTPTNAASSRRRAARERSGIRRKYKDAPSARLELADAAAAARGAGTGGTPDFSVYQSRLHHALESLRGESYEAPLRR